MHKKYLGPPTIAALGAILLALLFADPRGVLAQCGQPTQCNTCHNIQGALPVHENGAWHITHMPYNACHVCHGGDRNATDKNIAHSGVLTRLDQMAGGCGECHTGADLSDKYRQYAEILGAPTEIDLSAIPSGSARGLTFLQGANLPSPVAASAVENPSAQTANWVLAGILAVLLAGGGSYVYSNERHIRAQKPGEKSLPAWIWARLRRENWSPYAAGLLLGAAAILAVAVGDHLLSASGGIANIASSLITALAPKAAGKNMYFKFIYPPGFSWPVALLVGVFLGGLLASLSSGTFRLRWNDDPTWRKVFGPSRWKRFVLGFIGAVILQFGASIAGGCTSGLAISGGMLLAPSAFLFMAGMFASGILVALLIYRRKF